MTKLCDTCEYLKFCARSGIEDVGCDRYKRDTTTNEEWLKQANTEQLARVIHLMTTCCYVCGKDGVDYKRCYFHKKCAGPKEIEEWLKEIHE